MIVLNLFQNIALILALALVHQMLAQGEFARRFKYHPVIPLIFSGLAFGGLAIVGMLTPLRFAPGVIFDGRSIILSVAGLFGGPVVAAVAALTCGGYRLWLGGNGTVMGMGVIFEAAALGVAFHYLRKRHPQLTSNAALWAFGLLVHVIMLLMMMLLPAETRWGVIWHIGPPVLIVYPLATMIICRLFIDRETLAKTETALMESEAQYRELVERANSIILRWDTDGRITFLNEYGSRFFGFSQREIIGRHIVGTIVPETESTGRNLADLVREIAALPERHEAFENENMRRDGTRVWVAWTNRPILDGQGRCVEILAVGNDITERRRAEEALRESNQLFSLFMQHSPIYTFIKSVTPTESRVLQASDNFRDMVGVSGRDMIGKTMAELFPAGFAEKITADDWSVVATGEVLKRDEDLDGRNYTTIKFPIVMGDRTLLAGYTIDITERRLAEEALRLAHARFQGFVDANIVGVLVATPAGAIIDANDYYLNLVGFSREEFRAGKVDWRAITPPEWLSADDKAIQELRERGACTPYEKEYLRRDGTRVPVLLADAMLPGPEEQIAAFALDLTERNQSEKALRESEEKHRLLFESMQQGAFYQRADGMLLDVNDAALRMFGISKEEFLARDSFHPAWKVLREDGSPLPGEEHPSMAALRTGLPVRDFVIGIMNRLDNTCLWVIINAIPEFRNGETAPYRVAVTMHDITDRKRAEEGMREAEWKFRALFEQGPIGVAYHEMIYDASGTPVDYRFIDANQSYIELTGVDPRGKTVREAFPGIENDDFDWIGTFGRVARTGESVRVERHLQFNDSWYDCVAYRYKPDHFVAAFTNITERKRAGDALRESEERYRELVENANSIILRMDKEGNITFFNEFALRFFGYTQREIAGRNVVGTIVPETDSAGQDLRAMIADICSHPERYGANENENMLHDGTRVWVAWTNKPLVDQAGRVVEILSVGSDITARRQAEAERAKLEAQLQQSQKMESVGLLAGGVAHDFNNMLGVILGFTEMALLQVDPALQVHEDLEEIRKAASRSADLTRQLLAFARKQTVMPKVLDLNETVAGILKMLERMIGEDIRLNWHPGGNLWPVKVDPSQIDQVLANLCVNARDAITDTGTVTIETANRHADECRCNGQPDFGPGDYVLLMVSDNGHGMTPEMLTRIFEPFFTTKEMGKGTGLGLATIYGIIKQNKGFIDVRSAPGRGTTFDIYLPRHADGAAQAQKENPSGQAPRGHETILLVEDEPAFLKLTTVMLERAGYSVLAASTPGEAIRLAGEHGADIALLMTDVVMPEMNGRDLAKHLLSLYPKLRRLFMSGHTADVIAHHGVLDEGTYFIHKPFSTKDLTAKVREVLDREEGVS